MAAPKGNKFAIGNTGREKIFETVESLQESIDLYFKKCDEGEPTPYTIEGLCCLLDCDRKTLLNYEKTKGYEEYFRTIKKAKAKIIQNKVERGLNGDSPSGFAIFDLINNSDYKQTQTNINDNTNKNINIDPKKWVE